MSAKDPKTPLKTAQERKKSSRAQPSMPPPTPANQDVDSDTAVGEHVRGEEETTGEITNKTIFHMLQKMSRELEELKAIKQTTLSVEAKLSSLLTRVSDVEERVSELEDAFKEQQDKPPAVTKADLEDILERLATAEDRARRNNLRFVGIAEGAEGRDIMGFLNRFMASALGIDPPAGGFEMESAHRIRARRPAPNERPRTIIVAFLRHRDRQRILQASREIKKIIWEGKQVMVFPDFSRETQERRESFKLCKKALHERKMKFSLLYPARLSITMAEGPPRVFDNPQQAMDFIQKL